MATYVTAALLAAAAAARADSVLMKGGLRYDRAAVIDAADGMLRFRINGGRPIEKALGEIAAIEITTDGQFTAAERTANSGKLKQAISAYKAALRGATEPWKKRLIRYRLTIAAEAAGDIEQAVRGWLEIVDASGRSPGALASRPRKLPGRGDAGNAKAIAALQTKAKNVRDPVYLMTIRQLLADLYEREGRLREAEAIAAVLAGKPVPTDPSNGGDPTAPVAPPPGANGADIRVAKLALKAANPRKALRQLQPKLKTFNDKDLPTVLYLIGKAQAAMAAKRADAKAARDLRIEAGLNLMRVVALFPDSEHVPEALFEAGQISEGLGNDVAARAAYREVMSRYGKTPAAGQAKVALESLDGARK